MLALIGLGLIALGWIIQLSALVEDKKLRKIDKWFLRTYLLGSLILVYDGFSNGLTDLAIGNSVIVVFVLFTCILIRKRK